MVMHLGSACRYTGYLMHIADALKLERTPSAGAAGREETGEYPGASAGVPGTRSAAGRSPAAGGRCVATPRPAGPPSPGSRTGAGSTGPAGPPYASVSASETAAPTPGSISSVSASARPSRTGSSSPPNPSWNRPARPPSVWRRPWTAALPRFPRNRRRIPAAGEEGGRRGKGKSSVVGARYLCAEQSLTAGPTPQKKHPDVAPDRIPTVPTPYPYSLYF
ncbi:hypothetical protein H6P81_020802 [Aristolochia fimbriata]|uniref:Uncharacterized protein n=1 Tax=Aristolochia fimbriata TaxID=158543 RepID=A0AAV7DZW4_ARIFI|nr:hypothetical protein H6P81_020802 [Aristolochia fimbriata]